MCETLREPVKVLKSLSEQAINKQYKFKRLYRNLYNPEFYFLAYKNISQSQGSMTSGVDGKSLDGMSEKRIRALIESIRSFSRIPQGECILKRKTAQRSVHWEFHQQKTN